MPATRRASLRSSLAELFFAWLLFTAAVYYLFIDWSALHRRSLQRDGGGAMRLPERSRQSQEFRARPPSPAAVERLPAADAFEDAKQRAERSAEEAAAARKARQKQEDSWVPAATQSTDCPAHAEVRPLNFFPNGRGTCRDFGGKQSLPQRARSLRVQPHMPQMHCGFLAGSAFDSAARQVVDHGQCDVVVLTAIFGAYDNLVQPRAVPAALRDCFFAFVDTTTRSQLLRESALPPPNDAPLGAAAPTGRGARVGVWRLVTVGEDACKPYGRPRRNSRVPKLLSHRFFPRANYTLWINPDLALMMDPTELVRRAYARAALRRATSREVQRFLVAPGAVFAALRHFKRRTVLEEKLELIKDFEKNSSFTGAQAHLNKHGGSKSAFFAGKLQKQWDFYEAEQAGPEGRERVRGEGGWAQQTELIDSGMLLQDVRSPTAQLIMCNWFNEFHRFMERDLIAFSYVVMQMGLTPRKDCAGPVHFIHPKWHWYNTALRETDVVLRCGHRANKEFKKGCEYLRTAWPV